MRHLIDPVKTYSQSTPDRMAVGDAQSGRCWSWKELDEAVDRLSAWMVQRFGEASGARVGVLARNHPSFVIIQFACVRAGAIFVPFNWRLAGQELVELMIDSEPSLLIKDEGFLKPDYEVETLAMDCVASLGEPGTYPPKEARRSWSECSTLLYSSGTSGTPKGVMVTEENIFWCNAGFNLGSLVDHESVFLCDLPLFHISGLLAVVRAPILAGGSVWITDRFDPAKTIARIGNAELSISHYFSVPQMATTLWQHPDFSPELFQNLKLYVTGGAPNPKAQVERFASAGIRFSDGFGMTETGSNFAMPVLDFERYISKAGSCGFPLMGVQARIVDEAGVDLDPGVAGELWVKGPSVSPGYWNKPELTAKAFLDGWFKTGDQAMQDEDGYFYLVDRKKDMYISGGENVYPAEVERVLSELEEIAQAAVIGVRDERWGEVGRAFIVLREGASLSEDAVLDHCISRLAKFKVPVKVVFMDELPATGSGKVQKHMLPRDE